MPKTQISSRVKNLCVAYQEFVCGKTVEQREHTQNAPMQLPELQPHFFDNLTCVDQLHCTASAQRTLKAFAMMHRGRAPFAKGGRLVSGLWCAGYALMVCLPGFWCGGSAWCWSSWCGDSAISTSSLCKSLHWVDLFLSSANCPQPPDMHKLSPVWQLCHLLLYSIHWRMRGFMVSGAASWLKACPIKEELFYKVAWVAPEPKPSSLQAHKSKTDSNGFCACWTGNGGCKSVSSRSFLSISIRDLLMWCTAVFVLSCRSRRSSGQLQRQAKGLWRCMCNTAMSFYSSILYYTPTSVSVPTSVSDNQWFPNHVPSSRFSVLSASRFNALKKLECVALPSRCNH